MNECCCTSVNGGDKFSLILSGVSVQSADERLETETSETKMIKMYDDKCVVAATWGLLSWNKALSSLTINSLRISSYRILILDPHKQ